MDDDEITLFNTCTDLVSLRKTEAFPRSLLATKPPGEWIGVHEFCEQIGVSSGNLKPEVFAAWLPDPLANDAYSVILFYDDESKWSMAANYNRERILAGALPKEVPQPDGGAVSAQVGVAAALSGMK